MHLSKVFLLSGTNVQFREKHTSNNYQKFGKVFPKAIVLHSLLSYGLSFPVDMWLSDFSHFLHIISLLHFTNCKIWPHRCNMTEGIQMHVPGSVMLINSVFGNKLWWYTLLGDWNQECQHSCCASDFMRNRTLCNNFCSFTCQLILPGTPWSHFAVLCCTRCSPLLHPLGNNPMLLSSRMLTAVLPCHQHLRTCIFHEVSSWYPWTPHSFSQDTPSESEDFNISMKKVQSLLATFSVQRDFRHPREGNLAKKMAGFGNKSSTPVVAHADFSEGAVGVHGSVKTLKDPPEFYFLFFSPWIGCIPTLKTSELPGWTLGGARTVVCREIHRKTLGGRAQ